MMYAQNQLFRTLGPGNFDTLVQAVAKDPSMLIWLDADTSHKNAPNQNFARELMERFTMGAGNYSQEDVIQAARCFTGWELDMVTGEFFLNPYDHDGGVKHFLGRSGRFGGEDIIKIVTHEPASHHWVVSRLWSWLAYPVTPRDPVVAGLRPRLRQGPQPHQPAGRHAQPPRVRLPGVARGPGQAAHRVAGRGAPRPWGSRRRPSRPGTSRRCSPTSARCRSRLRRSGAGASTGTGSRQALPPVTSSWPPLSLASRTSPPSRTATGTPTSQVIAALRLIGLPNVSNRTKSALLSLASSLRSSTGSYPAQQIVTLALLSPEFAMN